VPVVIPVVAHPPVRVVAVRLLVILVDGTAATASPLALALELLALALAPARAAPVRRQPAHERQRHVLPVDATAVRG
jgi:hypothetical protein